MTLISYAREADQALERFKAECAERERERARALEGDVLAPEQSIEAVLHVDPFAGAVRVRLPEGSSLADAVAKSKIGPRLQKHLRIYLDGEPVPRERWAHVRPRADQAALLRVEMAGGGDRGGKNPLRAILMLAVAVFASVVAGPIAGMLGIGGTIGTALVTTGLMIAGQMLVNALVPPPKTKSSYSFDQQAGNPYAQLTGISNRPGNWAPVPRIIGKRRLYPLLAAHPYTETQGSTQYLRMLLLVGYGPLKITDLRIGNTPIGAFVGSSYEIREGWTTETGALKFGGAVSADSPVTLYTKQIDEQPLSLLLNPNEAQVRTSETGATELSIDITFPTGLVNIDARDGRNKKHACNFNVEWRADGTGSWNDAVWIDGSSEYGTGTNGQIRATGSSTAVQIRSGRFLVSGGSDYEVRVTRTTAASSMPSHIIDIAYWTVLRSIIPENPVNMTGLCLIALRLKATEQLNGAPDTINCIAESYLPVWDADEEEWSYRASRNPAWGYVDVLRRRGTRQLITDQRFNLPQITAWAEACDAEPANEEGGVYHACDLVLEGGAAYTAAQTIASHGRAQFALTDGRYGIVRDAPQETPVMHISPRNSWGYRGSKAFFDIPHAFRVSFLNADKDYAQDEIIVYRDGYDEEGEDGNTAASKFDTLELPGCTNAKQAWREGRYHFGVLLLRPEEHVVNMDIESLRATKGDLVRFSHDVISIGLGSGRIASRTIDGSNVTHFELDSPVSMADGVDYAVRIRHEDGSSTVHALVTEDGENLSTVELATPVAASSAGVAGDLFQFGELDLETAPMIITRIEPGENMTARVVMADAQPGVWTADEGEIPPFNSYITTPVAPRQKIPATPSFSLRSDDTAVERFSDGTLIERIAVSLSRPSASDVALSHWQCEWRESDTPDAAWTRIGPVSMDTVTVWISPAEAGRDYDIRVRTVSVAGRESDWQTTLDYECEGLVALPADVTNFTATPQAEGVELTWDLIEDVDIAFYKIRRGSSWETGADVADVVGTSVFVALSAEGAYTFWIKAFNKVGAESENAATLTTEPDGSHLADLLSTNTLAELILSLETRVDETRAFAASLVRVDDIPLGTTIQNVVTAAEEGDEAIVEVIDLIGAANESGTAFVLNQSTVQVSPGVTLAQQITALEAADEDNSDGITSVSTAIGVLDTRVTSVEGVNTSQASSITSLNSSMSTANTNIAANASALTVLETTVESQGDSITANSAAITALESAIEDEETGLAASASAISALETTVTSQGGTLTAQASSLTSLSATVGGHTSSISTNASAIADIEGSAAFYETVVSASGGDLAAVRLTAGQGGSSVDLIATVLRLANVSDGAVLEVMRAVSGFAYFSNPVSVDVSGKRLTIGPGFGDDEDLLLWFGPASVAVGDMTRANAYFSLTDDAQINIGGDDLDTHIDAVTGGGGGGGSGIISDVTTTWGSSASETEVARVTLPDANPDGIYRIIEAGLGPYIGSGLSGGDLSTHGGTIRVREGAIGSAATGGTVIASASATGSQDAESTVYFEYDLPFASHYTPLGSGGRDVWVTYQRTSGSDLIAFSGSIRVEWVPG